MADKKRRPGRPANQHGTVQYSLYLTTALNNQVRKLARERKLSRNAMLVELIQTGLASHSETGMRQVDWP